MSGKSVVFTQFLAFISKIDNTGVYQYDIESSHFPTINNQLLWNFQDMTCLNKTSYKVFRLPTDGGVFFSFEFGSPLPRIDKLYNIVDYTERDNNRSEEEVELDHQFFVYIDINDHNVYISNIKKQTLFQEFIRENFNIEVILKPIYKDIDEFIETMTSFNEISFTHVDELYNQNSDIKKFFVDLYGNNAPTELTVSAKFTKPVMKNFIKKLFNKQNDRVIQGLIIKGKDEQNFENIFNTKIISRKITISVEPNTQKMLDYHLVHDILLRKLRSNE